MQEVILRCDFEEKGSKCGLVVPDNRTTTFALDAVSYEADLCAKHKKVFEACMQPVMSIARPTTSRAGKAVRQALKGKKGTFTTKDVRKWLQDQGREVSPTGRIPNALIEEYKEAQNV